MLLTPYVLLSQLTALQVLVMVINSSPWPGWMSAAAAGVTDAARAGAAGAGGQQLVSKA
jgi:hypothetical protein